VAVARPTLPDDALPAMSRLWPDVGQRLGLSKWCTHKAARTGEIPTVKINGRLMVPHEQLRQALGLGGQPPTAA
jgi:hypothetical protein